MNGFRTAPRSPDVPDGAAYRMAGIFVNVDKEEKLLRYTQQVDAQRQELSAKNKIMDLLIQGTVKLVDRYAACDFEEDIYHFYSQSLEDSVMHQLGISRFCDSNGVKI